MAKTQEVQKQMMMALKNKEHARKDALSLLLSALKAKAKDKREDLTEEEEDAIILKEIKQVKETLESAAGRQDIIEDCEFKLKVLSEFAPQSMSEEEIRAAVESVLSSLGIEVPTVKEKGLIMKNLMPLVKGKADGKLVNQVVEGFFQK